MDRNTPSRSEFSEPTTTSADSGQVVIGEKAVVTATQPSRGPIIEIRGAEEAWPAGYKSVEDFVSKSETDPARKAALEDARRWAADTLYPEEKSLRTIRLNKGLSQTRLAEMVGTNQAHIARIEGGAVDVQVGTLVRLAQALDTDDLATIEAFLKIRRKVIEIGRAHV